MQRGFSLLYLLVGVAVLAIVGGAFYFGRLSNNPSNNQPRACTQEAKICPDGSSVGRTGPNCEFTPCPSVISTQSVDETANWKIYTSKKKEFSFKYPNDWYMEDILQYRDGPSVGSMDEESVRFFRVGGEAKRTQGMAKGTEQLIVTLNNNQQSFDQLKQSLNLDNSPTEFNGKPALRYTTGVYILLDPTKNRILSVYRPQYPDNGVLDQILATFKFN